MVKALSKLPCALIVALIWLLTSPPTCALDRVSERARQAFASGTPNSSHKLWLFLDEGATSSSPIELTAKARSRRAKVEPQGLLIDERDYPVAEEVLRQIRGTGVRIRRVSRWLRAVSVEATSAQLVSLKTLPSVHRVDLVITLQAPLPTRERPMVPKLVPHEATIFGYGLTFFQNLFIKAVKLHQAGLTGMGVMIAILDSGFEVKHRAFDSTNIAAVYDFINDDTSVDEFGCPDEFQSNHQNYHGTLVFGVLGGYVPDTLVGVAPGADYVLAKTEITCGGTEIKVEEDNWIAAAEWADSLGADIITSSVGYTEFTDSGSYAFADLDGNTALTTIAADIAASKNILVLNAAGNHRLKTWGHINSPADGDSVVAVGAVGPDSVLASFSSPGPTADGRIKPDIVALGVGVLTAHHIGGYTSASGTSLSTPLVAGGAALALEYDGTMTAAELRELIRTNGNRNAHPDNDYGYGLFDAARTADIVRIDSIGTVTLAVDEAVSLSVTSSGRADETPSLTAFNLPVGASFSDLGDGTGMLELMGRADNPPVVRIGLVADISYFADTTYLAMETSTEQILAAPNPFRDSVRIVIAPSAGVWRGVTIFNAAGERVWEEVNTLPSPADLIYSWDGRNREGRVVAAGLYLIHVQTDKSATLLKVLKTN